MAHSSTLSRSFGCPRKREKSKFAERLGVSVQYLRRLELARTNLTIPKIVELANALRVRVPELFEPPRTMEVRRGRPKR